jgi:uroporphyrinogen decarboxylase
MSMTEYTPRKRVLEALNHQEPDTVPIALGGSAHHISESRYQVLCEHFGLPQYDKPRKLVGFYSTADQNNVLDKLGTDVRYIHIRPPQSFKMLPLDKPFGAWVDEWGITHKFESGFYDLLGTPLAGKTASEIEKYPWPNPFDPVRIQGLKEEVEFLFNQTNYAIAAHRPVYGGVWEMARLLIGFENTLLMTKLDVKLFTAVTNKLNEVLNGFYEAMLSVVGPYVHVVEIADDFGTQNGPMVAPSLYREVIKPQHAETIRLIKKKAPQAKAFLHCCGAIKKFLPDFIDAGFDIINPVQPGARDMDPAQLKKEFGKDLTFWGGVDVQEAMRGSPEMVRAEVCKRIEQMAAGGGYVLAPAHNFGPDVSLENMLMFMKSGRECGRYPLNFSKKSGIKA